MHSLGRPIAFRAHTERSGSSDSSGRNASNHDTDPTHTVGKRTTDRTGRSNTDRHKAPYVVRHHGKQLVALYERHERNKQPAHAERIRATTD